MALALLSQIRGLFQRFPKSQDPIIPIRRFDHSQKEERPGNLYYVRLKTHFGILYKLGFTSLGSVHERFSYQGNGDGKLIDTVFLFHYFENALDMELALHDYFFGRSIFNFYKDVDMPLIGNGQSELYIDDVLEMDEQYTRAQANETLEAIHRYQFGRMGKEDAEIDEIVERNTEVQNLAKDIGIILSPVNTLCEKIANFFGSPNAKREYAERQRKRAEAKYYIQLIQNLRNL